MRQAQERRENCALSTGRVRANTMTLRERSEPGPKGPMTGSRARSEAASARTKSECALSIKVIAH
jgi:hypothetical protein